MSAMSEGGPPDEHEQPVDVPADVAAVLYGESIRLVTRQAAVLGELRTRASIVLTATSIVASLLGADALKRTDTFPLALLPAGALVAGLLCCLAVIRPVHDKPRDLGPRLTGVARFRALLWHKDTDPREWQVTVGGAPSRRSGRARTAASFKWRSSSGFRRRRRSTTRRSVFGTTSWAPPASCS